MGKQEISQKETRVETPAGVQHGIVRSVTLTDNPLPSPEELAAYKAIDPNLIGRLLHTMSEEQHHRHDMDRQRLLQVVKSNDHIYHTNIWGMFFAFLCIIALCATIVIAIIYDRPWIATIISGVALLGIVRIFINKPAVKQ